MILGLDLSTTVCGYCILSINGEIKDLNHYNFESKNMLEKAGELKKLIDEIVNRYNIEKFFIEERLQGFRAGGTNADAIFKTAALNFYGQVLITEKKIPIVALNVNSARANVFPGFHKIARRIKGIKHKELIFDFVKKELGDSFFPTKILKSGPKKGQVIFIEESKDRADAYVIAKAGLNLQK